MDIALYILSTIGILALLYVLAVESFTRLFYVFVKMIVDVKAFKYTENKRNKTIHYYKIIEIDDETFNKFYSEYQKNKLNKSN